MRCSGAVKQLMVTTVLAVAGENGGPPPPEDMSRTQLFSKLVDEREKCRVERLKNRQNEIILEQVCCAV